MGAFPITMPFLEILIIAAMIYCVISFFWNTKSRDLGIGVLAFFSLLGILHLLNQPVLNWILDSIAYSALIALPIIFQPEMRSAISKLSFKNRRSRELTEFDRFLDSFANSVHRMSEKKIGALIVLENEDTLDEYASKSIRINAEFSPELLETLFSPNTPLHDGAVLMKDRTIVAAAAILPLADDTSQVGKSMGTRHRAGLGLSHATDALIVIVSEETGKISVAREGIITRGIKIDRLKGIVRSIFNPPPNPSFETKFNFFEWLKK